MINIQKTREAKRRSYIRAVLRIFPKQACKYTVADVIWWLEELEVDDDSIAVPALYTEDLDFRAPRVYLNHLKRVWELKKELIVSCKAQDVKAWWIGGPPTDLRRRQGSFVQLLLDRIFADIVEHGCVNFVRINKKFKDIHSQVKVRVGFDAASAEWTSHPLEQYD